MAQVGIPKYKDLLNNKKIQEMQNNIKALVLRYNMMSSDMAIQNRESELFNDYVNQYKTDIDNISMIRQYAQHLVDICNEMNFIISKRSIQKHVYNWDDEEID